MNPVMYLIIDPRLRMSTGKAAAQAAHAAVEAFRATPDNNVKRMWDCGGHYAKVVLQADDLLIAQRYIEERGFITKLIIDEGRTEVAGMTPTALGVEIVDKDHSHVRATFGEFKLYKDLERITPPRESPGSVFIRLADSDEDFAARTALQAIHRASPRAVLRALRGGWHKT